MPSRPTFALVLIATLAASTVAADTGPYFVPLNAGFDNPVAPDNAVEAAPIDFDLPGAYATVFRVDVVDKLGGPVWVHVCILTAGVCVAHGGANDTLTLRSVPGIAWPPGTIARVWVWSARVFPSGDASLGSWGGVRAQWNDGAAVEDVIAYVGSGRTGAPSALAFEPEPCGSVAGATCATLPRALSELRVDAYDNVVDRVVFRACVRDGPTNLRCVTAADHARLIGPFPAGATLDVRPYAISSASPAATTGYFRVAYIE